jgi:hypothetical protein
MGAHAAVLAAHDRQAVRVLVLDGLYPDASYPLLDQVYGNWKVGYKYLGFLPRAAYTLFTRESISGNRAADIVPGLIGRDLLFVAPAGDTKLATAMEQMYTSVPEQEDADGNLVTLPSTGTGPLYGPESDMYRDKVMEFLMSRIGMERPGEE